MKTDEEIRALAIRKPAEFYKMDSITKAACIEAADEAIRLAREDTLDQVDDTADEYDDNIVGAVRSIIKTIRERGK